MEDFLGIVFVIGLLIYGVVTAIDWAVEKITMALNETYLFMQENIEQHLFVLAVILFFSIYFIFYTGEDRQKKQESKKKSSPRQTPHSQPRPQPRPQPQKQARPRSRPQQSSKQEYTLNDLEYYQINPSLLRSEIKRLLQKKHAYYSKKQTSKKDSVIKDAQKHKQAISRLIHKYGN